MTVYEVADRVQKHACFTCFLTTVCHANQHGFTEKQKIRKIKLYCRTFHIYICPFMHYYSSKGLKVAPTIAMSHSANIHENNLLHIHKLKDIKPAEP